MKKIFVLLLVATCLMTSAVSVSAIKTSDKPITGGNTLFTQKEFMSTGESIATSPWSNAFCNEDWTGSRWTPDKVDGIDCIKVVPVAGKDKNYMDFNYYQWNNDKYYPSLDCSKYKFFKVKFKLNAAAANATETTFWASSDSLELSKTRSTGTMNYSFTAEADKWTTVIIDCSKLKFTGNGDTDKPWSEMTVRQFRYYPFGTAKAAEGAVCHIEYMAFFETEAQAKAYEGPAAEAAKAAAATNSPKTGDPIIFIALAATACSYITFVASKKRVK